jgi:hypothetical protein
MEQTIFVALATVSDDPERNRWRESTRKLIFEDTFHNRFDRASVIAALRAHEADVIASVPASELLVYDVAEGWEPLCSFLGVDVPPEPFARMNTAAEFRISTGIERAE